MDTVVLRGTAKERGLQQGLALRHRIRALSERYRAICFDGLGDDRVVPVLKNMLRFVEKEFPEILEELEGIAESGGLTLDVVARLNFGSAIGSAIRGRNVPGRHCSAVAFSDTPDGAIIGKNSDLDLAQASYYALKIVVPNAGLPYLGYGEVGGPWVEAGINAKGLALGQASGPVHIGQDGYGMPTLHSSHLALQYTRSTREAVEFLSQIVHSGKGTNLMLADADGDVVAIERSLDRQVVRRPCNGALYFTNHFIAPELLQGVLEGAYRRNSEGRLLRYDDLLVNEKPPHSIESITRIISDHGGPVSPCQHGESGLYTQIACILIPCLREMKLFRGPACSAIPQSYFI